MKKVTYINLIIAISLFLAKFYAYDITKSQAILSDALESIVNIVAAIISMIVIAISMRPKDKDHPYGHGKIEYFAVGFEGGAICIAGIIVILKGFQALFQDQELQQLNLGLIVIMIAGIINALTGLFLIYQGKKKHSSALMASGKHVISDFYTSLGVFVGLILVKITGLTWLDPVVAIIVGLQLSFMGIRLFYQASHELMDAEDKNLVKTIHDLYDKNRFSGMIQLHQTKTLRFGREHHVDTHLVVPFFWSTEVAHERSGELEEKIIAGYPVNLEIQFHLDPCLRKYCSICDLTTCTFRKD